MGFLACLTHSTVHAREISIAFIEDGLGEPSPRLSELIVQELRPLLRRRDTVSPIFLGTKDTTPNARKSLAQASANPEVDFIIATGFVGSQEIYKESKFSKATYLLRVVDPDLTGTLPRDKVKNLQSYTTVNALLDVFERLSTLFQAKRVGVILPSLAQTAPRGIGGAVAAAAKQAGIDVRFIGLNFSSDVESQLHDLDAVILPPVSRSEPERSALLQALLRKKIPTYAVGGDRLVLSGALISDTLDGDARVLARRVALDLQLAISGESRTRGMRKLEAKKRTTINIDTARSIGVDFTLDEIMTARIVQGNSNGLALGFLSSIELAAERNLSLRGQSQQLQIDEESLEQARARKRPQLSAQLDHTRLGEQRPGKSTVATLGLSQTIYSPSANEAVQVAKLGLDGSRRSLEQEQLDTIQQTASAYFGALQTQAQFDNSLRDLALNRENLSLAEQRKSSGSGSGAEIYRWQAVIASSETAVLRAYTANTSAQSQLAQLLNTRMQIPTTLADVGLDQPPFDLLHQGIEPYLKSTKQAELLRKASAARALAQSPDLKSAAANVAILDTRLQALKRSYYTPELSIGAQAFAYPNGAENAFGTELGYQSDWAVGITATLPLWQGGGRRSQRRDYAAQRALADTQLQSIRIALWARTGDAVNDLVANFRAIALSSQAEEAALKSQQITQQAYKLGSASVTDLLDTQNAYREAQDNVHIARYQYLTALVDFQALMGDMPMLKPGVEQQQWLRDFKQGMLDGAVQ